jgi:maltose alpha-D-glucosyltransferase/alpha-amylase
MPALTAAALAWRDAATADFLKAYVVTARGRRKLDRELLDFFLLQKGFYEIGYEAANRPGWLAIPVRGVLDILRRRGAVQ